MVLGFSDDQIRRYARHIILPEIGGRGQKVLLGSSVLLVGAGGLGSPAALYLAAAGVGRIGLIDPDAVDQSNLQRQVLYRTADVGRPKVEAAAERLAALNPDVRVMTYQERLTSANALGIMGDYDVIVDGADNFAARYLMCDAGILLHKPVVHGSIFRFEGQVTVAVPGKGPCYRCLFPSPPPPGVVSSCAEAGVLGVLPGVIGSLEALEAIKLLLGIGRPLIGRLLIFDALAMSFHEIALRRDPACPACGENPSIRELIDYDEFCAGG